MSRSRTAGSRAVVNGTRAWLVKKVHRAVMSTVISHPFPDGTKANTRTPGPKYRKPGSPGIPDCAPRWLASTETAGGARQASPPARSVAAQVMGQHHHGRDPA